MHSRHQPETYTWTALIMSWARQAMLFLSRMASIAARWHHVEEEVPELAQRS